MTNTIPMIEARGSHREVGQQIGRGCRTQIHNTLAYLRRSIPTAHTWTEMLEASKRYLEISRTIYPQYIEELEGIAEGAGVPFDEVFLSISEELGESAAWKRGCTDLAARGRATQDGSTLVAHTNDLSQGGGDNLILLKIQAGDEPEFLAVSPGGIVISAGFNAAGISLTGNQLDNNDIRPGVPRLLVVRAILASRYMSEAMDHCLLQQRASSYNNVLADAHGEVYSMEGSATDLEPLYIENDLLVHANHYTSPAMRHFEANRNDIGNTTYRHNRAMRLLRENYGHLTPDLFQKLLADHAGYPTSICKHGIKSETVFSIIVHVEGLRAWIGRGYPCETEYCEYQLQPYKPTSRTVESGGKDAAMS